MRMIRTFAVSGAAAVALLGAAGSAGAVDQAAMEQAVTTPVALPDGGTIRVAGLDAAGYRADAGHHASVVELASAPAQDGNDPDSPSATFSDPFAEQQNGPSTQLDQKTPVSTQAGTGAISAGIAATIIMAIVCFFLIKRGGARPGQAVAFTVLGVLLSSTFLGPLVRQLTGQGVTALGGVLGGM